MDVSSLLVDELVTTIDKAERSMRELGLVLWPGGRGEPLAALVTSSGFLAGGAMSGTVAQLAAGSGKRPPSQLQQALRAVSPSPATLNGGVGVAAEDPPGDAVEPPSLIQQQVEQLLSSAKLVAGVSE